jgi:hypothetical protein
MLVPLQGLWLPSAGGRAAVFATILLLLAESAPDPAG